MRSTTKTLGVLAMVVLLVAGGSIAAAPSVDTEATDTATESEITDGHTVADFNASTDNISTLQYSVDSTDPGLKIVDPDTGDVIKSLTNASNPDYFDNTGDDGAGTEYYNVTLQESDFAAVPMGANENKSVTLRMVNNTTVDDPDMTNITIYLENTDDRAVVYAGPSAEAGDSETDTELDVTNQSRFFRDDLQQATVTHDNLAVTDNTTVYVLYADSDGADAYEAAEDNGPFTMWGDYSSEDAFWSHQVGIDGNSHMVFKSSAPSELVDDVTHAYTTSVDGNDAVALELGDEYEDETSIDVSAHANDVYGIWDRFNLRQQAFDGLLAGLGLSMSFAGIVVGRRRLEV